MKQLPCSGASCPNQLPQIAGLDIAGDCRPAGRVAGDYFDVLQLGDKVGFCIADVIGKGLPAALVMSNLQAAVKVTAADWIKPSELCHRVNELACRNGAANRFISFFYALYDPQTRKLTYTNAGHNPPILARANGECSSLESTDVVLGQLADWQFHDAETILNDGDRLVMYTDGITEAGSDQGEEFGEERLQRTVCPNPTQAASELLASVFTTVGAHCSQSFADDATCLVVSVR